MASSTIRAQTTALLASALVLALALLSACSSRSSDATAAPRVDDEREPPATALVQPEAPLEATAQEPREPAVDLAAVVADFRMRFQPHEGGFRAGTSILDALIADSGAITVNALVPPPDLRRHGPPLAEIATATIKLATVEIARARWSAPGRTRALLRDGAVVLQRGAVEERVQNTREGLEQSWAFAHRPAGAGPLRIALRVQGLAYRGATDQGLHFAGAAGPGFRYGHATWVDASGLRTAVPASFRAGQITFEVPAQLADESAYPAVLDPTLTAETAIDVPVVGSAYEAKQPSVAFDGTNYLVVWTDQRSLPTGVYGARVSPSGAVLDADAIIISRSSSYVDAPTVAFGGTNFLVVFEYGSYKIHARRVSSAGALLGSELDLTAGVSYCAEPTVAFDGTNFLVAFYSTSSSYDCQVLGVRVSATGSILNSTPLALVRDTNCYSSYYRAPSLIFDGTNYFLTWAIDDYPDKIAAARLNTSGVSLSGSTGFTVVTGSSSTPGTPAAAFDGTNYLVLWVETSYYSPTALKGARVSASDTVLGTFTLATGTGSFQDLSVTWDGTQYVAAWSYDAGSTSTSGRDVYAARIDTTGAVLDNPAVALAAAPGTQSLPALARGGTGMLAAWTHHGNSGSRIVATRLGTALAALDAPPIEVSRASNDESQPAAASDGTDFLVVWRDTRDSGPRIYGARVNSAGTPIDTTAFAISDPGKSSKPAVAFDGTNYFVVYERDEPTYAIAGRRVSTAGALLGTSELMLVEDAVTTYKFAQGAQVAFGNGIYLVVWQRYSSSGIDPAVGGKRVSAAGVVLDSLPLLICDPALSASDPAVASNGTNFLVVWNTYSTILGARVESNGDLPEGASPLTIATASNYSASRAAIASDGSNYFVVWQEYNDDGIHGVRVGSNGTTIGSPVTLATGSSTLTLRNPRVSYDGSWYQVTWGATSYSSYNPVALGGYIAAFTPTTLGAHGMARLLGNGPIDNAQYYDWRVDVASTPAGRSLVAYAALSTGSPYPVTRVKVRVTSEYALGVACIGSSECASGNCVDGVCCNTPCGGGANDCQACSVAAGAPVDGTCAPVPASTVPCRAASNVCDLADYCDGVSLMCVDAKVADGTACDDNNACTQPDSCRSGFCVGVSAVVCTAQDACHNAGVCNAATGLCSNPAKPNGTACNDTNACTRTDTCQAGACVGSNPVSCPAMQCRESFTCNPATGVCEGPAKADGSACNDGNRCTQQDSCVGGVCVGDDPVVCTALDACHAVGFCNPSTGTCTNPIKPNGLACDDGSACTRTDTCQAGFCVGSSPVVCSPIDSCHEAGACDPATGVCSTPVSADTKVCDDGDPCTHTDRCTAGVCSGTPIVCPNTGACQERGVCDRSLGGCGAPTLAANGKPCSDGNACTQTDACEDGVCRGREPVVCPEPAECKRAGTCETATGHCVYENVADGEPCDGGSCRSGACVADPEPDAGQPIETTDAGGVDAGEPLPGQDAGVESSDRPGAAASGCGCSTGASGAEPAMVLLAIALSWRRRR